MQKTEKAPEQTDPLVGAVQAEQPRRFSKRQTPSLANLSRLVLWIEHDPPEKELHEILQDARAASENSV